MRLKEKKKWVAALLLPGLLFSFVVPAQAGQHEIQKEEVVYANLYGDGSVDTIYVVNSFLLNEDGQIIDYGDYSSLRNMTSMEELQFKNQQVIVDAKAGRLYYEGILNDDTLPWDFSIQYWLDGKHLTAEELAGQTGHLQIDVSIVQNKECNPLFFENYALQVSMQLDTSLCRNIRAEDATLASVGRNKQLTWTILPGKDSYLSVSADVTDFEMEQISLNGITLSMALDLNEEQYGAMTEQMNQITDAAVQFDDGTLELFHGMEKLYEGSVELTDYMHQLRDGIGEASDGAVELRDGLAELKNGTISLQKGVMDAKDGAHQLKAGTVELSDGAEQLYEGAGELLEGVETLHEGVEKLDMYLQKLDTVIAQMEESLEALTNAAEQDEKLNRLFGIIGEVTTRIDWDYILQDYEVEIETLKTSIAELKQTREEVVLLYDELLQLEKGTAQLLEGAEKLYDGTAELKEGTMQLSDGTASLYEGLVELEDGTSELVDGTVSLLDGSIALADGLVELKNGSAELCDGAITLEDGIITLEDGLIQMQSGTMEFRNKTANLDRKLIDELRAGVDELFGNGDEIESFVSDKNENVQAVQFVIRTPSIEIPDDAEVDGNTEKKLSFWQKLLRLFGIEWE